MKRDIEDFSYSDPNEFKTKKFKIMPLSDNGFKEYIHRDSYTHYYLYGKHLGRYSQEVDERLSKTNKRFYLQNKNLLSPNPNHKANDEVSDRGFRSNEVEEYASKNAEDNHSGYQNMSNQKLNKKLINKSQGIENEKFEKINHQKVALPKKKVPRALYRTSNLLNNAKSNPYITTLDNLKSSLSSANLTHKNAESSYKGFKSTEVPRVDTFSPRLSNSPSEIAEKFKIINKKLKMTINPEQNFEKENKKIKEILKNGIDLPIIKAISQISIPTEKHISYKGKYMGEKYNPSNYEYHFMKSVIRRNVYGALYQH